MHKTKISSHTGFQPLREVWLGDVYPESFYDVLLPQDREFFHHITEITREDLAKIERKLIDLGISVRRPEFDRVDNYLDDYDDLCKPPITPRDWALTLGNELWVVPQYPGGFTGFETTIKEYQATGEQVQVLDRAKPDDLCYLSGPSTVRVGRDIFADVPLDDPFEVEQFNSVVDRLAQNYRVHITHSGDHCDGIFCPIAPGHIFSTHYRESYQKTFPNWEVFWLPDTTKQRQFFGGNWWVDGRDYQIYSDLITKRAQNWVGDFRETVFEVNMLVIDEKNVMCISENEAALRELERLGITPHVVDFRARNFWDGGLHCLTVDIEREGECLDYWPGRGDVGIYRYEANSY